jgi:hypothetical protein
MRALAVSVMLFAATGSSSTPAPVESEPAEFTKRLVDFDGPYEAFKVSYCALKPTDSGPTKCLPGTNYDVANYRKARDLAKRLFGLAEPK